MESQGSLEAIPARFWKNISINSETGCWLANRPNKITGYGQFTVRRGKVVNRHRYIMLMLSEPKEPRMDVDHLCRNRACCNPEHLEWVTRSENTRRGALSSLKVPKTHCPKGHEYTEADTYINPRGSKECLVCKREANKKRYMTDTKYRHRKRKSCSCAECYTCTRVTYRFQDQEAV